jgi:inorganic pyrophosphatase/exopolyphosphatase
MYLRNRVPIKKNNARLLLCAILSDTLNLKSGTTTNADRFAVALLTSFGEVEDVDELAMSLFTAKTTWIVGLGAYEMVRGDQKNFEVGGVRWSIAVLEVTALEPVLKIAEEILTQLRVFKYEKGNYKDEDSDDIKHDVNKECHVALLFVVDTVKQCSVALICGSREKYLAEKAFPEATWRPAADNIRAPSLYVKAEETLCDVGGLVSRKLEFMPKCSEALSAGVPDFFYASSVAQVRVGKVLNSDKLQNMKHDSVQVQWDKPMLKAACFYTLTDAALLSDILQDE